MFSMSSELDGARSFLRRFVVNLITASDSIELNTIYDAKHSAMPAIILLAQHENDKWQRILK